MLLGGCAEESRYDAVIDESERAWQQLVRAHGESYWYVETACGAGARETSVVEVRNGDPGTLLSLASESLVQCERGEPFRYGGLEEFPIAELHDRCRELLSRGGIHDVVLEQDEDGVLRTCVATDDDCDDACGYGFHIRERGFGRHEDRDE